VAGFQIALAVIFFANLSAFAAGTIIADYRLQTEIDRQALIRRENERALGLPPRPRIPLIPVEIILMKLRFAGIRRKTEFSPNHVVNDLLIINQTADELKELGAEVTMYDEGVITPDTMKENLVFSMAQGPIGSQTLLKIEKRGAFIINSPGA